MDGNEGDELTRDHFFRGKLTLLQPRRGYRFSLDAPMLAGFLPSLPEVEALEVGTGCGIISLMGLALGRFRHVQAIEVQPRLCAMAARNAELNGYSGRMRVVCRDFLELGDHLEKQELVFSNPPYFPVGRGRLSRMTEVRDARFETRMPADRFLEVLAFVLSSRGRACLIFPARREEELLALAAGRGLFPGRLRRVHSFAHDKPGRFLVQLERRRENPELMPPLVVFRSPGEYTPEMEALLSGRDHDPQDSRTG
ncbi:MAG: methyltransferase [Acidobacteriota bacterium]|jgi:tRNA1Val (adenine37-N6)-methyltransferase|nr:methyltransferase [Acidobacteriota bacterium]